MSTPLRGRTYQAFSDSQWREQEGAAQADQEQAVFRARDFMAYPAINPATKKRRVPRRCGRGGVFAKPRGVEDSAPATP